MLANKTLVDTGAKADPPPYSVVDAVGSVPGTPEPKENVKAPEIVADVTGKIQVNFFDENDRAAAPRQVCVLNEDISITVSTARDGKKQYTTSLSQLIPAAIQNDSPIKVREGRVYRPNIRGEPAHHHLGKMMRSWLGKLVPWSPQAVGETDSAAAVPAIEPTTVPVATKWDQVNYSCSYDALFAPLYDIWQSHASKWTDRFQNSMSKSGTLEAARDDIRKLLHAMSPMYFLAGRSLVAIDTLASEMFGTRTYGSRTTKCCQCDHVEACVPWFGSYQSITEAPELKARYKRRYAISHWLAAQKIQKANRTCPECRNGLIHVVALNDLPDIHLSIDCASNIVVDAALHLTAGDIRQRYALRGVIYSGCNHFTSGIIKENGVIWYHDGISTSQFAAGLNSAQMQCLPSL
ncbi:hypothetical protein B0H13DRAFT_1903285 [Mycena leptocephala]|nr:hypothetical protein B0H13DRAFT_1903285 [Mycena leptocephala]